MIDFYGKRWIYFIISGLVLLAGIVGIFLNGISLDIQFKGGAIIKYTYVGEIDSEAAAATVSAALGRQTSAQTSKDIATGEQRLILNLAGKSGMDAQQQQQMEQVLNQLYPDAKFAVSESSMVEPFFGQKFLRNGIIAILLAGFLIVIYVWYRFRNIGGLSAGVMALMALVHDVLVVLVTYILWKIPIGDSFVAVSLTILGYSINDTIVIYDRIRENARINRKLPLSDLVNKSINQSFTRSLNTGLAVLMSISMVYIFALIYGIDSIKVFALPMVLGTISGCYSTICIAGPLWVMWKTRGKKAGA